MTLRGAKARAQAIGAAAVDGFAGAEADGGFLPGRIQRGEVVCVVVRDGGSAGLWRLCECGHGSDDRGITGIAPFETFGGR